MTQQKQTDGRLIAAENDLTVLYWLHRFGGMTTRQLARLAWPNKSAGLRSAQRTTTRLISKGLILRRPLETGSNICLLTPDGAKTLINEGVKNVNRRGQEQILLANLEHRMLANEYAIDSLLEGYTVWTEHEIQRGFPTDFPDIRTSGGARKKPDLLINKQEYYIWVEVEHAPKKRVRIKQLLDLAEHRVTYNGKYNDNENNGEYIFHSLLFVVPNQASLRSVLRQIQARDMNPDISGYLYLDYVQMSSGLVWEGSAFGKHVPQDWLSISHLKEKVGRL